MNYKLKRTKNRGLICIVTKFNSRKIKIKLDGKEQEKLTFEKLKYCIDEKKIEDIYDLFLVYSKSLKRFYENSKFYIDGIEIESTIKLDDNIYSKDIRRDSINVLVNGTEIDLKKLLGIKKRKEYYDTNSIWRNNNFFSIYRHM